MTKSNNSIEKRRQRVRRSLKKAANGRPRLSVFRSNKQIYAQIIDDVNGQTVASASTLEKDLRDKVSNGGNKAAAEEVGKLIADRAKKAGVEDVIFDRGSYLFHGRVKALAEAAREGGLKF
jgi:large subunit ribosomal protein L18